MTKQNILIIGSSGNMGRRYFSCVKWLGHSVIERDLDTRESLELQAHKADKIILCTNTIEHFTIASEVIKYGKPVLVEKPIGFYVEEVQKLNELSYQHFTDVRMVCNWKYTTKLKETNHVYYDCYNTGKDGLLWDCIQLLYIDPQAEIKNNSPIMTCLINNELISLDRIAKSYVLMIADFIQDSTKLWGLDDAIKATKIVTERIENAKGN